MTRAKSDTVQVTMRIPREWLVKADALGRSMAPPGVLAVGARTVGLRVAIARGLGLGEVGK